MISTWSRPEDPHAYIPIDYDVSKTEEYLKKINKQSNGIKITMTHIFSRAMAFALSKNRREVGRIKWGNFQKAEECGVTVLVD